MKNMKLSALSLALLLATNASANDEKNESEIERIEVKGSYLKGYNAHSASGASRLELDIIDIPQSVSVITASQMKDYQLTNIDAVLDTATGVNVERIETDRTYYTARGFDITNFQVDGVGLPLSSGNNHADEDTSIYDRIEVIRGANGLMTGVGNPSATINFIRKRPTAENEININGTLSSWDNQRLELDGSYNFTDSTAIRTVIVKQDADSYLDRYHKEKNVFYVFLAHQLTENTKFSLSHTINDSQATGNNWGANPLFYTDGSATNYDISTSTSADWSYWDISKENTVLEVSHAFDNGWQLRGTYSHKSTDEDSELFYVYGTPDKSTELGLFGYASEYDNDDKHDLIDIYLSGEFEFFGREHEFVVGANHSSMSGEELSLYDYTTGNGFPVMPPLTEWDGNTPKATFADGKTGSDVSRDQKALYFTARFSLTDHFHLTAGGRQNDWEIKGESYSVVQDASDEQFIPYIGGVYQITDNLVAYASYTETFVSQTELDINNNVLAPITGKSQEVGIKSNLFDDKFLATVTYFETSQENVARYDDRSSPGDSRFIGTKGVESSGFEFDLAGELLPGLQTSIGFTHFNIDVEDEIDANVADYTPETLFKVAATYRVPQVEGLSLGINMRWQDEISRLQGVVAEGFSNAGQEIITKQKAYAVVGLMARYEFTEQLALTLNAYNVTDEQYINSLYWAQGYYAAPANYSATISWSL
ncbi:TonB-dependent siderophore receptor [Thalassotalea sp. W431]|uniref:TonB-dependent siderophore receptor n=2 Tax=Thalassotalea castellviae TaxID=3075612 RepID=A0ABU3A4I4_9GAMM|nr:TonB-dependent siderophore receptor [Thalassotalea sp. W431]MDT0605089.1 TonB-dependent siderophore receptor [Thalassotalea sp. W431]